MGLGVQVKQADPVLLADEQAICSVVWAMFFFYNVKSFHSELQNTVNFKLNILRPINFVFNIYTIMDINWDTLTRDSSYLDDTDHGLLDNAQAVMDSISPVKHAKRRKHQARVTAKQNLQEHPKVYSRGL